MKPNPHRILPALLFAALALPAAAPAQQQRQQSEARRARLQAQILTRFLDRASRELQLDAQGRTRLEELLRASAERRRGIARQALRLRQELNRALHDPSTPDREFERLLNELADLRTREVQLWREEQRELAGALTPRQRARLLALSARLNNRIRELRRNRREPPGAPPR